MQQGVAPGQMADQLGLKFHMDFQHFWPSPWPKCLTALGETWA